MANIDRAITFAAMAHKGTYRKGIGQPYIFHPLEVLSLVSLMTLDDDILCAAVLHDTVEDTDVSLQDIKENFSETIAELVSYETEDKRGGIDKGSTWRKRKEETLSLMEKMPLGSKMICLGDKVSNLRSIHLQYLKEGEKTWESFNQKEPLQHYWYYNRIKEELKELKDHCVYKEYCFLIDVIFSKYL